MVGLIQPGLPGYPESSPNTFGTCVQGLSLLAGYRNAFFYLFNYLASAAYPRIHIVGEFTNFQTR
jgi:hypothetical protein